MFIEQVTDETERDVSSRQLSKLLQFAEGSECRRVALLGYFGETYKDDSGDPTSNCGACDNCLTPREEFDGTEVSQKIVSCVLRAQKHSGFAFGLNHIVDILMGSSVEKIKKLGHDQLSTYGAGKGHSRAEWLYYGRELVSKGLLRIHYERFNILEVTQAGLDALKNRSLVMLKTPLVSSALSGEKRKEQRKRLGAVDYDEALFSRLRAWRVGVAKAKGLPAYMIFSDATLQAIAAKKPTRSDDLKGVSGIGEKKLALYGDEILEILAG